MLPKELQEAVRALKKRDLGIRAISRTLGVSRNSVRNILRGSTSQRTTQPGMPALLAQHPLLETRVRYLFKRCEGSAQRVGECLEEEYEIRLAYSTLTRFIRELGLRRRRRGRRVHPEILTGPGCEMQFDTSLIWVKLGSQRVHLYLANLICGFSRHRYAEWFPRWKRFHAQVFLLRALRALGGVPERVQIDNGREIVAWGSGVDAEIALEMEAFAKRLGFQFAAVEAGHKDRQGKVEKAHQFVQQNFLKGRPLRNLSDLNRQTTHWCERLFLRQVRGQDFAPTERWEEESAHLKALPLYVPEPARVWKRRVDDRGRVWLHSSSYRVPDRFVLKWLTLRETGEEIIVQSGSEEICRHGRVPECERKDCTLAGHPEHRSKRAPGRKHSPEEVSLRNIGPEVSQYLDALEARPLRTSYARLRRLYRFACEYPPEIFLPTIQLALTQRAFDLNRLEAVLEQKMGHRIRTACFPTDLEIEARPAYRKGQITPQRLRPHPETKDSEEPSRENSECPVLQDLDNKTEDEQ